MVTCLPYMLFLCTHHASRIRNLLASFRHPQPADCLLRHAAPCWFSWLLSFVWLPACIAAFLSLKSTHLLFCLRPLPSGGEVGGVTWNGDVDADDEGCQTERGESCEKSWFNIVTRAGCERNDSIFCPSVVVINVCNVESSCLRARTDFIYSCTCWIKVTCRELFEDTSEPNDWKKCYLCNRLVPLSRPDLRWRLS